MKRYSIRGDYTAHEGTDFGLWVRYEEAAKYEAVADAARAWILECENPVLDLSMRTVLRRKLFAAVKEVAP